MLITGGVALVAGAVTGTLALTQESSLEQACRNMICVGRDGRDLDRARAMADVATWSLIGAGTGLTAGAIMWWLSDRADATPPRKKISDSTRLGVQPWLGIAAVGCSGQF
jgi:hypothetical protein